MVTGGDPSMGVIIWCVAHCARSPELMPSSAPHHMNISWTSHEHLIRPVASMLQLQVTAHAAVPHGGGTESSPYPVRHL